MTRSTQYLRASILIGLMAAVISFGAFAQKDSSNHALVQREVKNYLLELLADKQPGQNVSIEVNPIDERIHIPACTPGFAYHTDSSALAQSYVSVRVSCNNNEWYLFANARVTRTRPVVITAGMISPGTMLTSENLRVAQVEVNRLRHTAYHDINTLVGARMKLRVRQGQPVQANMLCFICKGDRVTIKAQLSGMQIKTAGIAQQDGVIGDTISVLNASSRKTVVAEVASTQDVVVRL